MWHFLTLTFKILEKNLAFVQNLFIFCLFFWYKVLVCAWRTSFVISISALFLDMYMFTQNKGYNIQLFTHF